MAERKIYHSIAELVGETPLVELTNYEKEHDLQATVLAKLEYFNPSGSVKDRAAAAAIKVATDISARPEARGKTIVAICADNAFKYLSTNIYK